MDKIKPRTLSGFMELQPDKQVQMDKMRFRSFVSRTPVKTVTTPGLSRAY